ncbi:MBOAT family O-acyltransferase [Chloroflexota bacterium]
MLLYTPTYLLFLALVVLLYWVLPRREWQVSFLLAASYIFYLLFDLRFAILLFALTVVVYFLGKAIPGSAHPRRLAFLSITLNLGLLAFFKYLDFFIHSASSALQFLGLEMQPAALGLLLPIGISFYTFQAISYTTEIYRRKLTPAGSFLDFSLYMAFFPKLIAGPLIRPQRFLAQLETGRGVFPRQQMAPALQLLLLGLFKKIVIADSLASLADVAFRAADFPGAGLSFPTPLYIQGFYLYAFQIYADFSGYTDIALASAGLLGFELPENFRQPYLAATVTDFWNRWHISLTQWFREYMFFPLSRSMLKATRRAYPRLVQISANLITMAVIGLWHGAAWSFIAWGAWHGILLSFERLLKYKPGPGWRAFLSGLLSFHLVGLGWVLFRSSSLAAAQRFLGGLFAFQQMDGLWSYLPPILLAAGLVFGIDLLASARLPLLAGRLKNWRATLSIAALVLLVGLSLLGLARGADARPFIYAQF